MRLMFRAFIGEFDWSWVNAQIPILRVEDTSGIMAIDTETETPVGAAIFDNWTANSVQTHFMVTSPMVLKHKFLEEVYTYVFGFKKLKYMYGLVPANNEKAVKLNKHMGWTIKATMPEAYAKGVDYLLFELTKDNCKYLGKEGESHRKEIE